MALSSSLYQPRCRHNQSDQTRPIACWYRYCPASSSSASLYGTCHTWRMLILLLLSATLRFLVVCQLSGIDSISISFNYFSMSVFDFNHLLHGARGGESQTHRMCMQVSVSMSVFESQTNRMCMQVSVSMSFLSVFVLSVLFVSSRH